VGLFDKDLILKEIPLFANLSEFECEFVKKRSAFVEYKKGGIIYQEGAPPDAFYCVILGRVMIYTQNQYGEQTILEYLHRGKYFGIISLLTQEPHSVTTTAINDCLILVIKKDDFDSILKSIPQLAIDLSQTLSRRLKRKDIHQKTIFESTIVSIFSCSSQSGKSSYALNLALSLQRETRKSLIVLEICVKDKIHSLPQKLGIQDNRKILDFTASLDLEKAAQEFILKERFGIDLLCIHYEQNDAACLKKLVHVLTRLVNDYHYIILDLPQEMDQTVFEMINQSDLLHILSSPEPVDLKRAHHLIERIRENFNFQVTKIKIVINEYKFSKLSPEEQAELAAHPIFATLPKIDLDSPDLLVLEHPDCEYALAIRRIARQLGERLVGLTLGIGVAYGFCHIGVLKVIEEEKIPIDVISGSSIGALIASFWAIGMSSREILETTKEFREPNSIWGMIDLTFPRLGFIKGNKLQRFLKKHLGSKTFYDTKLPLKVVTSDVKRKEPRVLEKGLLADAIMASCTMPGVFTPFKFKDEMLFDGGVIHPLPTEPLLKMGVKKIIAVNVTPSRDDIMRQYAKIKEQVTVSLPQDIKKRHWLDFRQHFRGIFRTNILGIIFSSVEMLQSEVAQEEAKLADIVLHPDTEGLFWLELHRAQEFSQRGEEETRKNLARIWQVVNE
jgi:NTE family protein